MKLKTFENFVQESIAIHGNYYNYSKTCETYKNVRSKVIIECPIHGEFEQIAKNHLRGGGCKKCAKQKILDSNKNRAMTNEEFIKSAINLHGNYYGYSKVDYVNYNTPVIINCPIHGEFKQLPSVHLRPNGCKKCGTIKSTEVRTTSRDEIIRTFKDKHGNYYDYSKVNYINSEVKVIISCPKHGEFEQSPVNHARGAGCMQCFRDKPSKNRKTLISFINDSKVKHGDKYDYSKVQYITNRIPVTIICNTCNKEFEQDPHSHLAGYGCPSCKMSIGESIIENFLINHSINFEYEKIFKDCKTETGHWLSFDFYLQDYNLCIEYDGIQHFKSIGNDEKFQTIVKNDSIKNLYCQEKNIKLLRISYNDLYKIDIILLQVLNIENNLKITVKHYNSCCNDTGIYPIFTMIDNLAEFKYIEDFFITEHNKFLNGELTPFYFVYNKALFLQQLQRLKNSAISFNRSMYCVDVLEFYYKHIWFMNNAKSIETWETSREKIITNREKYADLKPRSLRRYFKIHYMAPNMFQDSVARFMASQIRGNLIYDPFAGFGGRCLGTVSLDKAYIGNDLNILNVNAGKAMIADLNLQNANIENRDSRNFKIDCDGVITSPPFYNRDNYNQEFKSLQEFQETINQVFKNISFNDKVIIDFKQTNSCSLQDFKYALPFKTIVEKKKDFGGLNKHHSIHTWFYCK